MMVMSPLITTFGGRTRGRTGPEEEPGSEGGEVGGGVSGGSQDVVPVAGL